MGNYFRGRAKALANLPLEQQEVLFNKLKAIGLNTNNTADVLDLKVEDILSRRLPTIVASKGIANTPKHARQLVAHKKIMLNNRVVDSPSYLVSVSEENSIKLKVKSKKPKAKPVEEQPIEETTEDSE